MNVRYGSKWMLLGHIISTEECCSPIAKCSLLEGHFKSRERENEGKSAGTVRG